MPEENQVAATPEPQTPEQTTTTVAQPSPFSADAWATEAPSFTPPTVAEKIEQPAATPEVAAPPVEEEEILDPSEWLKREYGVEPDALKAEREEYKKLKEQTPAEIKFENEQSKLVHELLKQGKVKEVTEILNTQAKLDHYVSADVNDETAADIIKLGMQLKHKELTPAEIDFKYNKEFGFPKPPSQSETETDEDFAMRKADWEQQVADIKMNRNIQAKLTKPELDQLKAKIVLPEIEKPTPAPVQSNEPTPEQMEAQKKWAENFLNTLESNYSKAEGFSTKVKDESVEIPIAFKIPEDDRNAIKGRLAQGFNVSDFIDQRWFDANGNPKVEQMIMDIYELENRDKVHSGIANNAAAKRMEAYIKSLKNQNVNQVAPQQTFQPQNGNSNVSPFSKDAWSEQRPPIVQN